MRSAEEISFNRRPCLTGGAERLSIYLAGERTDRKEFFAGEKSPFTNTAKSPLFCSPKVNISLLFTEDLQNGEILGENWINDGFYWGSVTGVCCAN